MPVHNKDMAAQFLSFLDPAADRFTFQFFADGPGKHAEIFHGSLDQVWPKVLALNTPERRVAVFVTVNETDFGGRRAENILRPRALFVDADNRTQVETCVHEIEACNATPSMIVKSGRGLHAYWLSSDIPRDQFSILQKALIKRLGTDASVNDLPRVMRLPGTLHLKDEARPRMVTLCTTASPPRHWTLSDLDGAFGLSGVEAAPASNVVSFKPPEWTLKQRPAAAFAGLPLEALSDGVERWPKRTVEEIRSAVEAIPPSAIAAEEEWVKFARGLAHEAAAHPEQAEQLREIMDTASRRAPGYNEGENGTRWSRYVNEAFHRDKPITIASIFDLAKKHGWPGYRPSEGASSSLVVQAASPPRAVSVSSLPLVPPKRQWLHGTDLVRGAVTLLAAPGGRAKSTWLLTCALACASGRDLLNAHVFGGPLRVLCLSTEDGLSEMALRLRAAMRHYNLTDADVPGLFVIGADGWGLPLLQAIGNRAVLDSRGLGALAVELDHVNPDVLIIDPLINLMGGVNGNDNAAAALLMGQLARLAATRRIAIALAHHASKGRDPASAESAMGAASFVNLARVALAIEPLDEKNAGTIGVPPWEAKSIFRVLGTKQNFAPPSTQDRWFRLASIDMLNPEPPVYPNGDHVAVVEPCQPGSSSLAFPLDLVRDALLVVDGASPPLSPSKRSTGRYAAPVIADAIARHRGGQASEMDGKSVLDHLMQTGLVDVAEVKIFRPGKGADVRKGLVLTAAGKKAAQPAGPSIASSPTPQSPESPAIPLRDDAGGDPLGSPATQGGCGGNAGGRSTAGNMPRDSMKVCSDEQSSPETQRLQVPGDHDAT
jgi:hypothetical protein